MRGKQAFVVEDNKHMRRLLEVLLREQGLDPAGFDTCDEANLALAARTFDIGLVDIGLRHENGLDLVRMVRMSASCRNHKTPIVIVSGQGGRKVIEEARDCGADAFLVKPVSAAALVMKIAQVLASARTFIDGPTYFGPERRRDGTGVKYCGPERRTARRHAAVNA